MLTVSSTIISDPLWLSFIKNFKKKIIVTHTCDLLHHLVANGNSDHLLIIGNVATKILYFNQNPDLSLCVRLEWMTIICMVIQSKGFLGTAS